MIKQIIAAILLAVTMLQITMSPVSADIGDNIGGGSGGGAGGAIDSRYSYSTSLPQGYRITLISKSGDTVKQPIDIVNSGKDESFAKQVKKHFAKTNKLSYLNGSPLREKTSTYNFRVLNSDKKQLPEARLFNQQNPSC